MALGRLKVWGQGEILTHVDLNAEFDNLVNNSNALVFPLTADADMGGFRLKNLAFGSVSAPSFYPSGDTNTGVYFSAPDTVDITAGATRVASFSTVTAGVNYLQLSSGASGGGPVLTAAGIETNIPIVIGSKGLGGIFFSTNSANRFFFSQDGHFLAALDNNYDIGQAGVNRPRNIFAGGQVIISDRLFVGGALSSTGSTAGDTVIQNGHWYRFMNNSGTSAINFGILGDGSNNIQFVVPTVGNAISFNYAGTIFGQGIVQNSGFGLYFVGESTGDHPNPGLNNAAIYTIDNGAGKTKLMARFGTGAPVQIAIEP